MFCQLRLVHKLERKTVHHIQRSLTNNTRRDAIKFHTRTTPKESNLLKNRLNIILKSNKLVFRQIRKYADEAGKTTPKKRSWAKFIGWKGPISMDKVVATINLVLLFPGFLLIAGTTTAISGIIWILNRHHKWQGNILHIYLPLNTFN